MFIDKTLAITLQVAEQNFTPKFLIFAVSHVLYSSSLTLRFKLISFLTLTFAFFNSQKCSFSIWASMKRVESWAKWNKYLITRLWFNAVFNTQYTWYTTSGHRSYHHFAIEVRGFSTPAATASQTRSELLDSKMMASCICSINIFSFALPSFKQ